MQTASENFWKRWDNRLHRSRPHRLRRDRLINGQPFFRTFRHRSDRRCHRSRPDHRICRAKSNCPVKFHRRVQRDLFNQELPKLRPSKFSKVPHHLSRLP